MTKPFYITIITTLIIVFSLAFFGFRNMTTSFKSSIHYDLKNPSERFSLPKSLQEISGIDFLSPTILASIQDEKGIVYFYDLATQRVQHHFKFEKKGDYEEVCMVENHIYILRSDGDLYRIKNYKSDNPKVKKYEKRLKSENDTEGLCYDKANNRLLILCKEKAGDKKKLKGHKAVYAFDLKEKKIDKKPVFTLDVEELAKCLNVKQSKFKYKPSAIEIHPIDGSIYIVDSIEKSLTQLSPSGEFSNIWLLPKTVLPQPEGIAFDLKGNLYISTEASDNIEASIVRFDIIN